MYANPVVGFVAGVSIFVGYCLYVCENCRGHRRRTRQRHSRLQQSITSIASSHQRGQDRPILAVLSSIDDDHIAPFDDEEKSCKTNANKFENDFDTGERDLNAKQDEDGHDSVITQSNSNDKSFPIAEFIENIDTVFLRNLASRLRHDEKMALLRLLQEMTGSEGLTTEWHGKKISKLITKAAERPGSQISQEDLKRLSTIPIENVLKLSDHLETSLTEFNKKDSVFSDEKKKLPSITKFEEKKDYSTSALNMSQPFGTLEVPEQQVKKYKAPSITMSEESKHSKIPDKPTIKSRESISNSSVKSKQESIPEGPIEKGKDLSMVTLEKDPNNALDTSQMFSANITGSSIDGLVKSEQEHISMLPTEERRKSSFVCLDEAVYYTTGIPKEERKASSAVGSEESKPTSVSGHEQHVKKHSVTAVEESKLPTISELPTEQEKDQYKSKKISGESSVEGTDVETEKLKKFVNDKSELMVSELECEPTLKIMSESKESEVECKSIQGIMPETTESELEWKSTFDIKLERKESELECRSFLGIIAESKESDLYGKDKAYLSESPTASVDNPFIEPTYTKTSEDHISWKDTGILLFQPDQFDLSEAMEEIKKDEEMKHETLHPESKEDVTFEQEEKLKDQDKIALREKSEEKGIEKIKEVIEQKDFREFEENKILVGLHLGKMKKEEEEVVDTVTEDREENFQIKEKDSLTVEGNEAKDKESLAVQDKSSLVSTIDKSKDISFEDKKTAEFLTNAPTLPEEQNKISVKTETPLSYHEKHSLIPIPEEIRSLSDMSMVIPESTKMSKTPQLKSEPAKLSITSEKESLIKANKEDHTKKDSFKIDQVKEAKKSLIPQPEISIVDGVMDKKTGSRESLAKELLKEIIEVTPKESLPKESLIDNKEIVKEQPRKSKESKIEPKSTIPINTKSPISKPKGSRKESKLKSPNVSLKESPRGSNRNSSIPTSNKLSKSSIVKTTESPKESKLKVPTPIRKEELANKSSITTSKEAIKAEPLKESKFKSPIPTSKEEFTDKSTISASKEPTLTVPSNKGKSQIATPEDALQTESSIGTFKGAQGKSANESKSTPLIATSREALLVESPITNGKQGIQAKLSEETLQGEWPITPVKGAVKVKPSNKIMPTIAPSKEAQEEELPMTTSKEAIHDEPAKERKKTSKLLNSTTPKVSPRTKLSKESIGSLKTPKSLQDGQTKESKLSGTISSGKKSSKDSKTPLKQSSAPERNTPRTTRAKDAYVPGERKIQSPKISATPIKKPVQASAPGKNIPSLTSTQLDSKEDLILMAVQSKISDTQIPEPESQAPMGIPLATGRPCTRTYWRSPERPILSQRIYERTTTRTPERVGMQTLEPSLLPKLPSPKTMEMANSPERSLTPASECNCLEVTPCYTFTDKKMITCSCGIPKT